MIKGVEEVYVISRSYGDDTKYFPVAATFDKDVANALMRAFGGIVTEVPHLETMHTATYKEEKNDRY